MKLTVPFVPDHEWSALTSPDRPYAEAIHCGAWRVANLYSIRNRQGVAVPFVPSREQRVVIFDLLVRGYKAVFYLKARKLGVSTVLGVICADTIAFNAGVEIALVDRTKDDAERKLQNIVGFALESLPAEFKCVLTSPDGLDNKSTIGVSTGKGDIPSRMDAGVSFRGGTPQWTWISEWGTTQFDNPARSQEIKTGAMEAARYGVKILESTWKGPRLGDLWPYVEQAQSLREEDKSLNDWRLRFFPWWVDRENAEEGSLAAHATIDAATHKYLDEKETELSIRFTPGQRLWYFRARQSLGLFMKRENPTTLEECWSAPIEGAIYADLIERIRGEGRICNFERQEVETSTFWDLGSPQNTCVWYVQRLGGGAYDVIDCDFGLSLTTAERVEHMKKKGYTYDAHYIPHDGAADQKGGITFQDELMKAGLANVRVVPRTKDIEVGIDSVRNILPRCRFHAVLCENGIEALEAYHAKVDDGTKHRSETIVHNFASHPSDAFRTLAEAESHGMLSGQGGRRFDVQGVKALDDKAKVSPFQTGVVIVQERGVMFRECPVEESWLAMVGRPQIGRFHLLAYAALHQRHVWAVLRADFREDEYDATGLVVLAASLGDGVMDPDIAAQRVAAMSQFYGSCLIVPVADDPEGTWRSLLAHGADRVLKRPKSVITKSAQQIGWAGNEDMGEPLAALAKRVREEQLECFHQPARAQLGQFMRQPGGKTGAMPGYSDEWVRALAVGCQCVGMASPFNPAENRRMRQDGMGAGSMFAPSKMSSL